MQTAVISIFIYIGNVYFFDKMTLVSKNAVFFSLSLSSSLFMCLLAPFCLSIFHDFLKEIE